MLITWSVWSAWDWATQSAFGGLPSLLRCPFLGIRAKHDYVHQIPILLLQRLLLKELGTSNRINEVGVKFTEQAGEAA